MSYKVPFQKPFNSAHDLVRLLQSRGLTVTDTAKAERYLEFIGYYRLSAYMYPLLQMPKEQHRYKSGTTFSQVMTLYRFDKKFATPAAIMPAFGTSKTPFVQCFPTI